MQLARLCQKLFNVPLALKPDHAEIIVAALAERLGIGSLTRLSGEALALYDDGPISTSFRNDPGYDLAGNVAVIPIHGTLVQRTGALRPICGMTGLDSIRQSFLTALTDHAVEAIVLDVDSPGGEMAGLLDMADTIYSARGTKPIWAILNESAYSAAYALASAADRVTVPRTGGTGSIGVIFMHVDWSQALTDAGLKVTFIQHGDRKTDGHPEIPLSKEARASFQQQIDAMGDMLVETIACNRGLAVRKVRDTQAATYLGADGVEQGLADQVLAPSAAFRRLVTSLA